LRRARRREGRRTATCCAAAEDASRPSHFETSNFVKGLAGRRSQPHGAQDHDGAAQSVAIALDKARWPEVCGHHRRRRHDLHRDRERAARSAGSARAPPIHLRTLSPMTQTSTGAKPILLAFPVARHLVLRALARGDLWPPVVTLTVDTGSIDAATRARSRATRRRSAPSHTTSSTRGRLLRGRWIRFLIMGNVRRGNLYPLCVGAERVLQAQTVAQWRSGSARMSWRTAPRPRATTSALRVALRTLAPGLEILAPCARPRLQRPEQLAYLEARSLPVRHSRAYSVNRGLWGHQTIGARRRWYPTAASRTRPWVLTATRSRHPQAPERHTIGFEPASRLVERKAMGRGQPDRAARPWGPLPA